MNVFTRWLSFLFTLLLGWPAFGLSSIAATTTAACTDYERGMFASFCYNDCFYRKCSYDGALVPIQIITGFQVVEVVSLIGNFDQFLAAETTKDRTTSRVSLEYKTASKSEFNRQKENRMRQITCSLLVAALLSGSGLANAALTVKVDNPKSTGQKAVIKLTMKNTFSENIESARAVVFLLDGQGKVVGQMSRWVIGGTKDRPALAAHAETTFSFVVETTKPFTTTKVNFTRVILEGGKLADPVRDVTIQQ